MMLALLVNCQHRGQMLPRPATTLEDYEAALLQWRLAASAHLKYGILALPPHDRIHILLLLVIKVFQ